MANNPLPQSIDRAVQILRAGGLVAFPTETVYGLGADATNSVAVGRIFAAKGRPATNPLIAHVADEQVARRYAADWPESAGALVRAFWPGPLTLVLPKRPGGVVAQATAGLPSVALRAPDHPLAIALLRAFDGPIAAPSANRSTHVSPTIAKHVRDELGGSVDLVLDGGPCRVGIESTVIDLTTSKPTILRPGAVTREQIEQVIGPVRLFAGAVDPAHAAASPGQQEVHYAPVTPAFRFEAAELDKLKDWLRARPGDSIALLRLSDVVNPAQFGDSVGSALRTVSRPPGETVRSEPGNFSGAAGALTGGTLSGAAKPPVRAPAALKIPEISADPTGTVDGPASAFDGRLQVVTMPASPEKYASNLYATLREWDARGIDAMLVEMPPDEPAWLAVRDRLCRATRVI